MFNVVNVVITANLGMALDLAAIAKKLKVSYHPETFDGVVYRIKSPKFTVIFLKNGKVVFNLKKLEDLKPWQSAFEDILRDLGIEFSEIKPEIQNIVTASDLGRTLDLDQLIVQLGFENAEYHPENFVGLVYRVPEYHATLMIFRSGKVNIMGTKKLKDTRLALKKLKEMINIE
ncbi:MAG: hypothetical protein SCH39_04530 [Methanosarcinales archaeon]|nr:hypothetical protein [ANME-2 cluster archaeon]MDF1531607.1 hypothetical protein [ANME-2 cluster archaeon]MDW7775591.1 hypothetical protein [Methanosarcinales archaeon]